MRAQFTVKLVFDLVLRPRAGWPVPRFGPEVGAARRRAAELKRDQMVKFVRRHWSGKPINIYTLALDRRRDVLRRPHRLRLAGSRVRRSCCRCSLVQRGQSHGMGTPPCDSLIPKPGPSSLDASPVQHTLDGDNHGWP
jgi:hypothetical protein